MQSALTLWYFSTQYFGIKGLSLLMASSAVFPVASTCHIPFPSGGKSVGGHSILLLVAGKMRVPKTLDAGSKPSLMHILMRIFG